MSSILILSIWRARDVACLALDAFAEKRAHECLQLGNLLFGLGIVRRLLLPRLRRGQHVIVVIARIYRDLAVVQVGHVRAHAVQKMTVMRDDHHGAVARVENVFQPADGVDVEVVGRLVQQQDVRVGEQCLRQQHAQLEAGRDCTHGPVVLL